MNTYDDMTYKEHLQWAKDRAIEILDSGEKTGAWASLCSDLQKHSETRGHSGLQLGMMLMVSGNLSTSAQMREFIEGFN